ncbi:MFS transporter [Mycolicibacterium mucogenicum]|uniref:MFS transporter n=1 Tax=Mycolicibacterium mucogenicum TaxID=56689 RepID=A0A1A0N5I6_MYCMU|nr:MFS transporter [Mycolicibacterium mucogenicum]
MAASTPLESPAAAEDTPDLPPVSTRFIAVYAATSFGANLTMLMPSLFGLAYKIQLIDPAGKETALGLVVGVGALFNIVVTPLAGVLTDRTRLRWGRRRPWVAAGIVVCGLSGLSIALAPSVILIGVAWVCYIIGLAAILSALTPIVADQVPQSQRGRVAALAGVSAQLAGVAGGLLGSKLTGNVVLIFVLPVALLAVCFLFYVRTVPDHPAAFAENPEPLSQVFRQLLFDPREHRDFTLVWIGRFLLQTGLTFFSTYQLYFLLDRLNLSPQDAGQKLALVGGIGIAVTTGFAVMGGVLSDRWQRRKVFIYFASALAAAGLTVMAFAPNVIAYSAATLLILAAAGLFGSVDLAMAGDVVPDKSAAGRWMSILNVAGYIPSAIAPVLAPLILAIGSAPNYTALYLTGALIATGAGFTAWRIRAVR